MVSAQVVLINEDGLILGVSRKHDHNDFGLVGGRMDPEDGGDPKNTAIRECKEETGLDITDLKLVFAIHKGGNMGYTYLAKYSGEINHNEPHVVAWLPFQTLVRGSFGRYNQLVAESLDDMDVDYVYKLYKGNKTK
jgi:8-oxo-dGTP pyrophosphatase MutT (NUDIX family)